MVGPRALLAVRVDMCVRVLGVWWAEAVRGRQADLLCATCRRLTELPKVFGYSGATSALSTLRGKSSMHLRRGSARGG